MVFQNLVFIKNGSQLDQAHFVSQWNGMSTPNSMLFNAHFLSLYIIKGPDCRPAFSWNEYITLTTSESEASQFLVINAETLCQILSPFAAQDHMVTLLSYPTHALSAGDSGGKLIPAFRQTHSLLLDRPSLSSMWSTPRALHRPPSTIHIPRGTVNKCPASDK